MNHVEGSGKLYLGLEPQHGNMIFLGVNGTLIAWSWSLVWHVDQPLLKGPNDNIRYIMKHYPLNVM